MCGRFGLTRPERLSLERFGVQGLPELGPRYNIAPGTEILVIGQREGERKARLLRWGLVPYWADDPSIGQRLVNARADTAFARPAFRRPMEKRRCLIPADLFYEWQAIPGQRRKQPYAVRMKSGEPFALGGLWDFWRPKDGGEGLATCIILTTEPNELLAPIHDRMPVIVPADRYAAWLDPHTAAPGVLEMCRQYPSAGMEAWRVSPRVNDAAADDASVIEPVA
jgi:putative SOS response-associated peptidase YedK